MAWLDRIQTEGTALRFYAWISGLPYIFANFEVPTTWDVGGGTVEFDAGRGVGTEIWTWSHTLVPAETWAAVSMEAQPFAGIAESGALDAEFLCGDDGAVWLDIVSRSVNRGLVTSLDADAAATATTLTVGDTTGWTTGDILHARTEAIEVGTVASGTSFTGCLRGRFGSQPRYQGAEYDAIIESGNAGPYLANHPLLLRGRTLHVWQCTGRVGVDGVFVPFGLAPGGAEDREVYAGEVGRHRWGPRLASILMESQDLTQLLARPVYSRFPTAFAGPAPGLVGYARIDGTSNRFSIRWSFESGVTDSAPPVSNQRLRRDDGGGGYEDVPDGWYAVGTVVRYVKETLDESSGWPDTTPATWKLTLAADSSETLTLKLWTDDAGLATEGRGMELLVDGQSSPLWPELGFRVNHHSPFVDNGSNVTCDIEAADPMPIFRYPATGIRPLYYHGEKGPEFVAQPVRPDEDSAIIYGHVRLGDEILEFQTLTDSETINGYPVRRLDIIGRAAMGTTAEEIYVPYEYGSTPDALPVRQVLAFPNVTWQRMVLQLMMSGSGVPTSNGEWDRGWRGMGAYIDQRLVDAESLLDTVRGAPDRRDNWCISEPMSLRDILTSEIVLSQVALVSAWDAGDNAHKLRAVRMGWPLEADQGDALELGPEDLMDFDAGGNFLGSIDDADDRIVNVIQYEAGFDNATGAYSHKTNWRLGRSTGSWDEQEAIELKLRGIRDPREAEERVAELGARVTALFGEPYSKIELPVAIAHKVWPTQIGRDVLLTHDMLVDPQTATRGITAKPAKIYEVAATLHSLDGDEPRGHLTMVASHDARVTRWAPSAVCYDVVNLGGGVSQMFFTDHVYSLTTDPVDLARFSEDQYVRAYYRGDEGSAELLLLDAPLISASPNLSNVITASPLTLTPPFVIEFADYNEASLEATQRRYAYQANAAGKLNDGAADVAGFRYT